ncbi:hypothetical protein Vadar_004593 [Vaccinium darrowii]|uniref:Uncharacterized protein n=1 Tax=Vaccinium darrowii TaxID=229202 RepID=A0ACB7Z1V9_9ERIC|nr:hypothetical protein Vadar_004593 [Vaccinium darrowii]
MMENRGANTFAAAWGSILLPRELFIGGIVGGCKQTHCETYYPAQFARQFGMVQAIPCPYPGEVNVPLYVRKRVDKNVLSRLNVEYRKSRVAFKPSQFSMDSPIFNNFSRWWHNLIDLYNQTPSAQGFANHIGCSVIHEGEGFSSSLSVSDDGFGVERKNKSQQEQRETTPDIQSSALVPVALDVQPLRSVPQIVTRSQQQRTPPPTPLESTPKKMVRKDKETAQTSASPEAKKRKETLVPEQKLSQEEAKFAKAYKASKQKRKILIEEPEEEEEIEDITIGQFVKERRTKSRHAEAFKTPAPTPDLQAAELQSKFNSPTKTTEVSTPVIPLGGFDSEL